MEWDKEEIALRIMRIFFQYNKDNKGMGLPLGQLVARFDFSNVKKGKEKLEACLTELIDLSLIYRHNEEYFISDKGKEHYEEFKFLRGSSPLGGTGSTFHITTWNGNYHLTNNDHSKQDHPHYDSRGAFPENRKEFIPHFKAMHDLVEQILNELQDHPIKEDTYKKIEVLKDIIEQYSFDEE